MNILIDDLPTKIQLNDTVYDINYDYRTIIKIMLAFEDKTLFLEEKYYIMVKLLYKQEVAEKDYEEAVRKGVLFMDYPVKDYKMSDSDTRVYSFAKDSTYIFTGINSSHHIDLEKEKDLHWWKFMALFMDMDNECFFSELIYYRKRKAEGKLTKDEKQKYKDLEDLLLLEEKKISKEKEAFLKELNG